MDTLRPLHTRTTYKLPLCLITVYLNINAFVTVMPIFQGNWCFIRNQPLIKQ